VSEIPWKDLEDDDDEDPLHTELSRGGSHTDNLLSEVEGEILLDTAEVHVLAVEAIRGSKAFYLVVQDSEGTISSLSDTSSLTETGINSENNFLHTVREIAHTENTGSLKDDLVLAIRELNRATKENPLIDLRDAREALSRHL
jgi:hypothetical protein